MTLVVVKKNLLINVSRVVGRLGNSPSYMVVAAASITNSNWNWLSTTASSDWKIQHQHHHHHHHHQQQRYFCSLQFHPKNGHHQCLAPSVVYGRTRKQNLLVLSPPVVMLHQHHQRFFSSSSALSENHNQQKIRILYASQTGTAQLFANELKEAIEDQFSSSQDQDLDVTVQSLQEAAEAETERDGAESSPSKIFHVFDDDSMLSSSSSSSSSAGGGGGEVSSPRPPTLHIMLTSCAGVGEPPDNGRGFYEYIMNKQTQESSPSTSSVHYSVFGLGNKVAHTKYFNIIGKNIDAQLEKLGCTRALPLALGDDGDCIEDDFDIFVEQVLELIRERRLLTSKGGDDNDDDHDESTTARSTVSVDSKKTATTTCPRENDDDSPAEPDMILDTDITNQETTYSSSSGSSSQNLVPCHDKVTLRNDGMRLASEKYAPLDLQPPQSDIVRRDLFHLQGTNQQYYASETQKFQVVSNQSLAPKAGETAIHEMTLSLSPSANNDDNSASSSSVKYETGDHLVMYPRNSSVVAEAYLQLLDVHPHSIIQRPASTAASSSSSTSGSYPYPTGLTVLETLLHCVDLEAPPSPSFARMILGRKQVDYRSEIAKPRRTVLDLLLEKNHPLDTGNDDDENRRQALISLEDLLYNLTPMKPRYYSISSSSIANPDKILLAYRPIKYVTTRGALREGVCTSYMMSQAAAASGSGRTELTSSIPAFVSSNPTFRLPEDPQVPIVLVAGGCGVAPICAFVEERLAMKRQNPNINFGPCDLYIGFRSPEDQVYAVLGEVALKEGAISDAQVAYNFGCTEPTQHCMFVSDLLRLESAKVWKHLKDGGVVIVCGAGRTLGAAVEAAMMDLLQEHGGMTWEEAEIYMRKMVEDHRLLEDLAD
eukprot:CAMPEP_0113481714 /NCGR_PEP_ID=MMETSP0014_2-20120614/22549_1 /TAXON_ID=2857 /ORGANISM="Nitzschia sp." /LENGTH=879 /DNA_ID=CAMNT_0000375215 /DNA_START=10 /DNA_END=2649 /DNA_ORIENTATION=- /assembly_acc=CAM_ASM_000159